MSYTPQIELIQPACFAKLFGEPFFSAVNIFKIREKRLDTQVSQALAGLGGPRAGAKAGATIEIPMPSLRNDLPSSPGPECILEQRFITREQPTINLGANGVNITSESLAVQIIRVMHQWANERLKINFYPDKRPYYALPLDPEKPFVSHVVTMLTQFPISMLPRLSAPAAAENSPLTLTLTDTSGCNAAIYYTTDGTLPGPGTYPASVPANTSTLYTEPFTVESGTWVSWAAWPVGESYTGENFYTGSNVDNAYIT